jgi:hypothetical protein
MQFFIHDIFQKNRDKLCHLQQPLLFLNLLLLRIIFSGVVVLQISPAATASEIYGKANSCTVVVLLLTTRTNPYN